MRLHATLRLLATICVASTLQLSGESHPGAPVPRDHEWCATSRSNDQRIAELDRWVRARDQRLAGAGKVAPSPESRIENDIILLESTASSLPFHSVLDLVGRSLVFVPDGDEAFRVSTTALDYEPDVGAALDPFVYRDGNDWFYREIELSSFEFPFGGANHAGLYVTAQNAVHFDVPFLGYADQYTLLDGLSLEGAIISPLLHTDPGTIFPIPDVFVRQSPDFVLITWRSGPSEWGFGLDVQARLESSGRIVLSYRAVDEFDWGTVLVTTGTEPWRTDRHWIYSQGTPASGVSGSVSQMLDLRSVSIERLGESNLIEVTITVSALIRPEFLSSDRYLGYWVQFSDASGGREWIMLYVARDDVQYRTPGWGWNAYSPAAEFDGNTVRLRVMQDALNLTGTTVTVNVATLNADDEPAVDGLSGTFTLGNWSREFGSDLSALPPGSVTSSPVVEAFTLGELNPQNVWTQLKSIYGFTDSQIDAVAIYQDFYTSLILYAGAYSTVGNPGADGVSDYPGYGTSYPESPALLHMNRLGYRWNADLPRSFHVTSHEFGHRWLYFIDFDTGDGPSNALQPLGGHPAQYVHTPAAFRVYTDRDSSTMGGSNFVDHGDGTFSTPDEYGYYGYSWHDLYLMGLAAPEEVEDWYYIANTDPPLGGAYYPAPEVTVSGSRRNVTIDDVVRAMGPRDPGVATSQKRFKVVYVLLSLPGTEASPEAIDELNVQRKWFERMFKVATGHRGEVDTTLVPLRRRGVRLPQ
jgi:hypothetical protein